MFWMLVGGATLFALIVGGVLVAMLGGDAPAPPVVNKPVDSPPNAASSDAPAAQAVKSNATLLAEMEPLAKSFLEATSVEDLVPLVRHPKLTEKRMRNFYAGGNVTALGMASFNTTGDIEREAAISSVKIRTKEYEERSIAFVDTPKGLKIDWESWVGWSEVPWEVFLETKPAEAKVFRVNLSAIEYYNTAFTDDKKWQSYRLISPDGKHSIYGYAERGTTLASQLRPLPDAKNTYLILALKYPADAASSNQVVIERFITEGWVLDKEATQ